MTISLIFTTYVNAWDCKLCNNVFNWCFLTPRNDQKCLSHPKSSPFTFDVYESNVICLICVSCSSYTTNKGMGGSGTMSENKKKYNICIVISWLYMIKMSNKVITHYFIIFIYCLLSAQLTWLGISAISSLIKSQTIYIVIYIKKLYNKIYIE